MGNGVFKRPNAVQPVGIQTKVHRIRHEQAKDAPDGYCVLFAGAHTANNGNTCPILALYTWFKDTAASMEEDGRLQTLGGQPNRLLNTAQSTLMREFTETREFKIEVDQTIQMIPIEDIISVKVSTEVKKEALERTTSSLVEKPPEELTCCGNVKKCCTKNVCCCICKEIPDMPEYRETKNVKMRAKRVIAITIEYMPYSLLDTPSSVRLLSAEKQNDFYNKHFHPVTLKFNYMKSPQVEEDQYKNAIKACETLARIIMQLKAMIGQYPDDAQLKKIVEQGVSHTFGSNVSEDIPLLEKTSTQISVRQDTQASLHN